MQVQIDSFDSCLGFRNRIIKVGDYVQIPAGASDPATGLVIAILPTSWPSTKDTADTQSVSCLIRIAFGKDLAMYSLNEVKKCE